LKNESIPCGYRCGFDRVDILPEANNHGIDRVGNRCIPLSFELELLKMSVSMVVEVIGFTLVAIALSACSDSNVKSEVKSVLIDPSSAEFRSITSFKNGNYCGEVNSKNRMGGYVGYKAFSKVDGKLEIEDILRLDYVCEIAKDPIAHKCKKLTERLKYYNDELAKDNPMRGVLSREKIEEDKVKMQREYEIMMCLNK